MAERSNYLDIVKGLTISLVVFSHCIQYGSGYDYYATYSSFYDPLSRCMSSFMMPTFMCVSGFLFYYSVKNHRFDKVVYSRIKSLLIPVISWQTLYLTVLYITGELSYFDIWVARTYLSALWFLWSLMFCSFIVLIVHYVVKDSIAIYIIVGIGLLFIPNNRLDALHVFMYPYFVLAYLWNKHSLALLYKKLSRLEKYLVTGFCSIAFLILYLTSSPEESVYWNGTCILGRDSSWTQFCIDLQRYIWGGVGVVMFLVVAELSTTWKNYANKLFVYLGKDTLGIYALNNYTTALLLLLPVHEQHYILNIVETGFTLTVCYGITQLIKRHKITNMLFLGKR